MTHSIHYLTTYIPRSFGGNATQVADRLKVLKFKEGEGIWDAAVEISNAIIEDDNFKCGRFLCMPAHNEHEHRQRFCTFSKLVSGLAGLVNDFDAVRFEGERLAIHHLNDRKQLDIMQCCEIDVIPGERYILFDDVYTTGHTFETVAEYIEKRGGKIVGGYFLAKTKFFNHK